jgi:hypothetical protein
VLVLDYLKRMGRLTPEIEIKARKFINAGYQRLLTFEVPGGGFEWFGHSPAHVGLTAYGVLEFTDMNHVHPVDPNLMNRTRNWLFSMQHGDSSWNQASGLDSWSSRTPVTAYVAWALAESGNLSPNLDKALHYLRSHPEELSTAYQKALAANAFLVRDQNDPFGRELANQIKETIVVEGQGAAHWEAKCHLLTWSRHGCGDDRTVGDGLDESRALARIGEASTGLDFQAQAGKWHLWFDAGHHPRHARPARRKRRLIRPGSPASPVGGRKSVAAELESSE